MTRSQYAADITEATGWSIDYSRLGRYMRGELPTGKQVLAHLDAYAKARSYDPVDLGHREPERSIEERAVRAAESQAAAAWAQAEVLRLIHAHLAPKDALTAEELAVLAKVSSGLRWPASHPPMTTASR